MIKCICIDGYNTIENGITIKQAEPSYYLDKIAKIVGCNPSDIIEHKNRFSEAYGSFVWEYHEIFWRSLVKKYDGNGYNEDVIDEVYSKFLDFYEEKVELFDGTLSALTELSKSVELILVANGNSKRLKRLIRKYQFHDIFSDFVISSETPYQKPNKFMFEYCLKMYGWKPHEVMMVGDKYDNDVLSAKKGGLLTAIRISNGSAPKNCYLTPDFMVDSIGELINIVRMSKDRKLSIIPSINTEFKEEASISAFIVAGGKGSRLGELGTTTQKCMLNLWGKPMLYYTIVSLKNSGCSKIIISVNHLSEQVVSYFGDGSSLGVEIKYIQKNTVSTYDALYQSLDELTDRFVYVHANILFQNKLLENIIQLGNAKNESVVTVVDGKNANMKHAQVEINEAGSITKIDLKERKGVLPYTFLGVGYYKKSDFIENLQYDEEGYVENTGMVEKVIQQKINKGYCTLAYKYSGGWRHIETAEDYNRIRNENRWDIYYE